MAKKVETASIIQAAGNKPKIIEEFVGCMNSATPQLSIARMKSPPGGSSQDKRRSSTNKENTQ